METVDCVEAVESLRDRATDSRAVLKVVEAVEASLLAESEADEVGREAGEGCFGWRDSPAVLFRAVDVSALDRTDETEGAFDFGRAKPTAETRGTRGPTPVRFDEATDAASLAGGASDAAGSGSGGSLLSARDARSATVTLDLKVAAEAVDARDAVETVLLATERTEAPEELTTRSPRVTVFCTALGRKERMLLVSLSSTLFTDSLGTVLPAAEARAGVVVVGELSSSMGTSISEMNVQIRGKRHLDE